MPRKKRKSPYKHRVREHLRQGTQIHQYSRGSGDKPQSRRRKRVVGNPVEDVYDSFSSRIYYIRGKSERFDVSGPKYIDALSNALEKRESIKTPLKIRLRGLR